MHFCLFFVIHLIQRIAHSVDELHLTPLACDNNNTQRSPRHIIYRANEQKKHTKRNKIIIITASCVHYTESDWW